jgi:DNA adenine methylase
MGKTRKRHATPSFSRKTRSIKPPFCRQGNKFPIYPSIVDRIPPHTIYVEPFVGSGAVFFNKAPDAKTNVLNDLDKRTIERLRLLQSAPKDLSKYRTDLNTVAKIRAFYLDAGTTSPADRLFYEKIVSCNGFSGKPVSGPKNIYKKANPHKMLDLLPTYQEILKDVILTNVDYEECVSKYDGPGTFFFIDPPYENTVKKTYGYAEDADFDFERLAKVLAKIKGRFLMTINNSAKIRKIFSRFHQSPIKVYTRWGHTSGHRNRKELFVSNYRL